VYFCALVLLFRVFFVFWGHGYDAGACQILTFFLDINTILQLRCALLSPEQLLLWLAARQIGGAISMGVQLADAAA